MSAVTDRPNPVSEVTDHPNPVSAITDCPNQVSSVTDCSNSECHSSSSSEPSTSDSQIDFTVPSTPTTFPVVGTPNRTTVPRIVISPEDVYLFQRLSHLRDKRGKEEPLLLQALLKKMPY